MRRVLVCKAPLRPSGERRPRHVSCHVAAMELGFPQLGVSLALKTTASFARLEGSHKKADWTEARPWRAESPRPDDDKPLPDDLVPVKPLTDVVIVGHVTLDPAHEHGGRYARPVAVRVADVEVSFTVAADRPGRYPLRRPWIEIAGIAEPRLGAGPTPDPYVVGPTFEEGFAYEVFQAAPERLRAERLTSPLSITLRGLGGEDDKTVIEMPELEPHVLIDWAEGGRPLQEVSLLPDTVVVDLDEQVVDVVWRGNFEAERGLREVDRLLVGFARYDAWIDRGFGLVLRELSRGRFSRIWHRADVVEKKEPPPLTPEELLMARHEAMEYPAGSESTLSLAEQARITAHLLEVPPMPSRPGEPSAGPTRASVLAVYGLDEHDWGLEERALAERLATVAPAEGSVHEAWSRELDAALAAFARPEEAAVTARDYADLVVMLERDLPHEVLARAGLSLGSWLRLDKKWQLAMDADAEVRREIEERVAAERERLGDPPDVDLGSAEP